MAYTIDINKVAQKFNEPCCFIIGNNEKGYFGLYKVYINNVYFKESKDEKTSMYHRPIYGFGYTIEDAANDFFRRARTGVLYHVITDQIETVS